MVWRAVCNKNHKKSLNETTHVQKGISDLCTSTLRFNPRLVVVGQYSMADDDVVEGWIKFFRIVAAFLRDCERNEDTSDFNFVEYVCERLERSISSIETVYIAVTDASNPEWKSQISNLFNELTDNVLLENLCVSHMATENCSVENLCVSHMATENCSVENLLYNCPVCAREVYFIKGLTFFFCI